MKFLKIAGKDIKSIAKNRFIRVSVIAILIVPLLYSLLYLYAFWDPYARLADVPVAVVNKDKGTTLDGKEVNYGSDIIDELKSSTELGWKITNEKDAWDGLNGTEYYALIEIPENFSNDVISAKNGEPITAQISFTCNDKRNFLASQINSKVESELKAQITKTITNNYATVAFDNLFKAKDGMVSAADGATQIKDGLTTLNGKVPEMTSGVGQLVNGSKQLIDGQKQLNNGTKALYDGQLAFNNGVLTLTNGVSTLIGKVPELSNGVQSLAKGSEDLFNAYNNLLVPGVSQLNGGLGQLNSKLNESKDNIGKLSEGAKLIEDKTTELTQGATNLKGVGQAITEGYSKIQMGSVQLNEGVKQVVTGATETSAEIQNIGNSINQMLAQNPSLATDPNMQKIIKSLTTLNSKKEQSQQGLVALSKGANDLNAGITTFKDEALAKYVAGVNGLADGTIAYAQGSSQLAQGSETLIGSLNQVNSAVGQLSNGASTLYSSMDVSNKEGFGYGLASVAQGTQLLNSNIPKLASGATALLSGSDTLKQASGSLLKGVTDLQNGSNQLLTGQEKLYSGIGELNSKLPELSDGVSKLYSGSNELSTKLGDGANEMKNGLVNTPETMGNFISEPITLKATAINKVSNYGTGFAPYFIPLSLWIGAIMMFFVIPTKVDEDENANRFEKVFGKYLSFGIIGVLQALLVSVVVVGFLGLEPTSIVMFVLTNVFLSLVFIAIIQCLIFLLGDAGRLLGIVLLILQLTSCAGTFPLEVVPTFFKAINPFMPFTYAVEALREVVSATAINYSVIGKDFAILAVALVVFLSISVIFKNEGEILVERIEGKKAMQ